MKKLHIAGIVFLGLGIVSYLTTSDEDKAERAGFSSVAAYETAIDAGFDTKAEYDASLEQQRLIAQAAERGFTGIVEMQDAEARGFMTAENEAEAQQAGFDNRADYNAHLNEQSLVAQAAERGFSSVEEMEEAAARGFIKADIEQLAAQAGYSTFASYSEFLQQDRVRFFVDFM